MKAGRTPLHTWKTPTSVMETCVFLQYPAHRWSPLYDRHTGFTGFTLPVQLCIGLSTHWRQPWSIPCSDSHQKQLHLGKLQAVVTDLTCVTLQHLFPPCISPSFGTSSRSVLPVNVMLKIHQSDFNPHTACFSKVRLNCLTGPATVLAKLWYCQRGLIDHSGYLQKEWPQVNHLS